MLTILSRYIGSDASPVVFLLLFALLFLVIVGGALWLTPRLARWLDDKKLANRSYYDGMLEEDPNPPEEEKETDSGVER